MEAGISDIQDAINILNKGGIIIYPTETFFGIGCVVHDEAAIARIFQIKQRLFALPLPLLIAHADQLASVAAPNPKTEDDVALLQKLFWPGPLSLILPARLSLSPLLTGGTGNVAVRVSSHPVAAALSAGANAALVSSSANISGKAPAMLPKDLDEELLLQVDALVNMPPLPGGGEPSTLVEPLGQRQLKILRHGAVSSNMLEQAGFILTKQV